MSELRLWQFLRSELQTHGTVGLMVVADSDGSSPGRQGFKMAIAADGGMVGSIGGGIMEQKLVTYIQERLQSGSEIWELRQQVHSKEVPKNQSGMICSGVQWVAILTLGDSSLRTIEAVTRALSQSQPIRIRIDSRLQALGIDLGNTEETEFSTEAEGEWNYAETIGLHDVAHVIGGGHVGLEMCRVMKQLGFRVINYDDRPDLNTMMANVFADEKLVLSYEKLGSTIFGGPRSYVIIMTFGYRGDAAALRSLIGGNYAYVGMMGSETKIRQLWDELQGEGIPASRLQEVHAPAGLSKHSKTPAEIAVSIAAEIIEVRNRLHRA